MAVTTQADALRTETTIATLALFQYKAIGALAKEKIRQLDVFVKAKMRLFYV